MFVWFRKTVVQSKLLKNMLINLSNHPSSRWSEVQLLEAEHLFGEIVDLPFPSVNPDGSEAYVNDLADDYEEKILSIANGRSFSLHIMGELTLTFALLKRMTNLGVECVASTSERIVKEFENNKKEVTFSFVKFRKYC